jgi:hypothetical protein
MTHPLPRLGSALVCLTTVYPPTTHVPVPGIAPVLSFRASPVIPLVPARREFLALVGPAARDRKQAASATTILGVRQNRSAAIAPEDPRAPRFLTRCKTNRFIDFFRIHERRKFFLFFLDSSSYLIYHFLCCRKSGGEAPKNCSASLFLRTLPVPSP